MSQGARFRLAFVDEIQERSVADSLANALRQRGHIVHRTGKLTHGVGPAESFEELSKLAAAWRQIQEFGPDAVILFRPQAWPVEYASALRRSGTKVLPWLSDGPVLFKTGYARILEEADFVLHCGHAPILEFFDSFGVFPPGVNFPFWSAEKRNMWTRETVEIPAPAFMGNVHDSVRRGRISSLEQLTPSPNVFGKVSVPDRKRVNWQGTIDSESDLLQRIREHRMAINIPQRYKDYLGSNFDFPGLSTLGGFQTPSRIVQYASMGMPAVTLGFEGIGDGGLRGQIMVDSDAELRQVVADSSEFELVKASSAMYQDFNQNFTPSVRSQFLEYLLTSDVWQDLDTSQRATLYRNFDDHKNRQTGTRSKISLRSELSQWRSMGKRRKSRRVAIFASDWKSRASELQEIRAGFRAQNHEVVEWGPEKLREFLVPDPMGQFKALLSDEILNHGQGSLLSVLVLIGSEYGLTPGMWNKLRHRSIIVRCPADDAGFKSPQRARLASRADSSATMHVSVADALAALGLENHRFAPLFPTEVRNDQDSARQRTEIVFLSPNDADELKILGGTFNMGAVRTLVLEEPYVQYPVRARSLFRVAAQEKISIVAPRELMGLLAIEPLKGIRAYGDQAEKQLQVKQREPLIQPEICWKLQ